MLYSISTSPTRLDCEEPVGTPTTPFTVTLSLYECFVANVKKYKATAEAYQSAETAQEDVDADAYQVTFVDETGKAVTKRFSRIDYGKRGKLLFNMVTDALESMGQSISEQEKRQIIMDILKELC